MNIIVNGEPTEIAAETLSDLCAALGYRDAKIATALNGDFVPEVNRKAVELKENDRVEILAPRQGG